jgi:hypothetical protein
MYNSARNINFSSRVGIALGLSMFVELSLFVFSLIMSLFGVYTKREILHLSNAKGI